jgi:hypothetical protein
MLHIITGNRDNKPTAIMGNTPTNIKHHTPSATHYSWWMVDSDTNTVIKSYTVPAKAARPKVCTPRAGAWCNTLKVA